MIFIPSLAFVNLVFVASILNGITDTINNQLIAQLFSIRISWIFSAVIIILSGLISFKIK
jgi:hypothetical protein